MRIKQEVVPIARRFEALGYRIYATRGTARVLKENGVKAIRTNKTGAAESPNLMDLILGHKIDRCYRYTAAGCGASERRIS